MNSSEKVGRVAEIYHSTISSLNKVLIGQYNVKKAVASAILCDPNSRVLLSGGTGVGKTTLTKSLINGFKSQRISVTSDLLPYIVQEQLISNSDMGFLHIDEFNRATGKLQSVFMELFEEKQMTINGINYSFKDFYVFATQNSQDIAGIFNVPQAVYDRFDINVYFDKLIEDEIEEILFGDFKPLDKCQLSESDLVLTHDIVSNFKELKNDNENAKDKNLLLQTIDIIDNSKIDEQNLFAGSNIRAHKFLLKLAKLSALANGRDYIKPSDIAEFVKYVYKHRIDQNLVEMNDQKVIKLFDDVKDQVLSLKR